MKRNTLKGVSVRFIIIVPLKSILGKYVSCYHILTMAHRPSLVECHQNDVGKHMCRFSHGALKKKIWPRPKLKQFFCMKPINSTHKIFRKYLLAQRPDESEWNLYTWIKLQVCKGCMTSPFKCHPFRQCWSMLGKDNIHLVCTMHTIHIITEHGAPPR